MSCECSENCKKYADRHCIDCDLPLSSYCAYTTRVDYLGTRYKNYCYSCAPYMGAVEFPWCCRYFDCERAAQEVMKELRNRLNMQKEDISKFITQLEEYLDKL